MIRSKQINVGNHTARIVDVVINKNVRFGRYIADVIKPIYAVGDSKIKDNGIFHYKREQGFLYEPKKNWGYFKFLDIMKIKTIYPVDSILIGKIVLLEVYQKNFTNQFDSYVKYPVGRAIKVIKAPF